MLPKYYVKNSCVFENKHFFHFFQCVVISIIKHHISKLHIMFRILPRRELAQYVYLNALKSYQQQQNKWYPQCYLHFEATLFFSRTEFTCP